jgi:hypothetical protein
MKPTRESTAIFGLRYLEEEDLEINDIIGCQTVAANPNMPPDEYTFIPTEVWTNSDQPDYDRTLDQG